jgi:hypothetical protein
VAEADVAVNAFVAGCGRNVFANVLARRDGFGVRPRPE